MSFSYISLSELLIHTYWSWGGYYWETLAKLILKSMKGRLLESWFSDWRRWMKRIRGIKDVWKELSVVVVFSWFVFTKTHLITVIYLNSKEWSLSNFNFFPMIWIKILLRNLQDHMLWDLNRMKYKPNKSRISGKNLTLETHLIFTSHR